MSAIQQSVSSRNDHFWALRITITSGNTRALADECRSYLRAGRQCSDDHGSDAAAFLFAASTWNPRGIRIIAGLLQEYVEAGQLNLGHPSSRGLAVPVPMQFADGNAFESGIFDCISVPVAPLLRALLARNTVAVVAFLEAGALELTNLTPHGPMKPMTWGERQQHFLDLAGQIYDYDGSGIDAVLAQFKEVLMSRTISAHLSTPATDRVSDPIAQKQSPRPDENRGLRMRKCDI